MIFIVGFFIAFMIMSRGDVDSGAFILIAVFSKRATRQCRWREDRRRGVEGREKAYVCAACGAHALTANGKPPHDCHRQGKKPTG